MKGGIDISKKFNKVIISMSNKHENRVRNIGDMVISFINGNAGVWAYLSYSELTIDLTKKKVHYR